MKYYKYLSHQEKSVISAFIKTILNPNNYSKLLQHNLIAKSIL